MEMSEHGTVEQEIVNVSSKVMEIASLTLLYQGISLLLCLQLLICVAYHHLLVWLEVLISVYLLYSNVTIAFLD
jgi:hypothetical protein